LQIRHVSARLLRPDANLTKYSTSRRAADHGEFAGSAILRQRLFKLHDEGGDVVFLVLQLAPFARRRLVVTADARAPFLRRADRARLEPAAAIVDAENLPDARWVARCAACAALPDGPPVPLYLRAPDAKLPAAAPLP